LGGIKWKKGLVLKGTLVKTRAGKANIKGGDFGERGTLKNSM